MSSVVPSRSSLLFDVVVLSATPGGIMAAVAAARRGCSVLLLERTQHVGGLPANGLGATDIQTRGATGGLFFEFAQRILAHYVATYGAESRQARDCSAGYHFEPSVAESVLELMLSEHPAIAVVRNAQFDALPENVRVVDGRPSALRVTDRQTGAATWQAGRVFIDASYEGDLAAACGVAFRLGREAADAHHEPRAGVVYAGWREVPTSDSTGRGDAAIQAYNYRLCLTRESSNRAPIARPEDYRREEYLSLVDDVSAQRWTGRTGRELELDGIGRVVNLVALPNGKYDANNQHLGFLSTDLPEENVAWPTAGWSWRDAFARRLRDYTVGLLWFCQNDEALPPEFRQRCSEWGFARDEYQDNGHFPRQVYVREARRIVGRHLFTALDTLPRVGCVRPPLYADSVTASHYPLDSHAIRKREPGKPHLEGFFNLMNVPYTVPFGVMVPQDVPGLLVPVAVSSTHVGFSSLRMEPCWMALGEAAGTAAAIACEMGINPGDVPVAELQQELRKRGAVLVYVADVSAADPLADFVQRWALRGGFPDWHADLDGVMDEATAQRWQQFCSSEVAFRINETRREYLIRFEKATPRFRVQENDGPAPRRNGCGLADL